MRDCTKYAAAGADDDQINAVRFKYNTFEESNASVTRVYAPAENKRGFACYPEIRSLGISFQRPLLLPYCITVPPTRSF